LGSTSARHTFASLMIVAGVNAKALQTFMAVAGREWPFLKPLKAAPS
jgi:hypothetical protein